MATPNTPAAYGSVHRTLHWVIALLVIPQLLIGDVMLLAGPHAVPTLTALVHPTIGILIGLLMIARLRWRARQVLPEEPADIGITGQAASSLTHYAFYALLIVNPLFGYGLAYCAADHVFFGPIPLPHAASAMESLGTLFFWLHLWCGVSIGLLIALHVVGALSHEFVLKDNVLRRMLGFPRMTPERALRQRRWPERSPGAALERAAPDGLLDGPPPHPIP
jgi:cytochrome b561